MRIFIFLFLIALITACQTGRVALFTKKSPHEQYADGLKSTGLDKTKMGSAWLNESTQSFERAVPISLPYQEAGYFPEESVKAFSVKFYARRGEQLTVVLNKKPPTFNVYIDLWEIKYDAGKRSYDLLASKEAERDSLVYEMQNNDTVVLRIQPELLSRGEYTLVVTNGPSLGYPFKTPGKRDIQSFYGDQRDKGARKHEGIDLFAPKRTPVLAIADGRVTGAGENTLGGKVVWQKTKGDNLTLYYAHLDTHMVSALQQVNKGDTIGLVGNTGNAKYTAPHLHLGIYTFGGSIDPLPFVQLQTKQPPEILAPLTVFNSILRTTSNNVSLFTTPEKKAAVLEKLPAHTILYAEGAVENWYKVMLPDSTRGFVSSKSVTPAEKSLQKLTLKTDQHLLDHPDSNAGRKSFVMQTTSLSVLGNFEDFLFVSNEQQTGWIQNAELKSSKSLNQQNQ